MTFQARKRTVVASGRLQNRYRQPTIASGPTSHGSGVRNLRGKSGAVLRSDSMHTATAMNANSVPAFASAAISFSGSRPAMIETITPVMSVINTGEPVRGLSAASRCGRSPSRAMTKKIRDWPYMKAMITVGSASTAAPAISVAASGWLRLRRTRASGSGLAASDW